MSRLAIFLQVCLLPIVALAAEPASTLADAMAAQDRTQVRELLTQGVDVNASQADGMTAIHWAAYHDEIELAKDLVRLQADVNATNRYGVPPLFLACENGSSEMVLLLLKAGADPNASLAGGETMLMTAARTGDRRTVVELIRHGAKVNEKERSGQTAIMWAAAAGNTEAVDALIESEADFTTPLRSGFTPLFFAVREGRMQVVERLLEAGADVNETMQPEKKSGPGPVPGMSPLLMAVENGHFELAEFLLQSGADANDARTGYTALHAITWVRKPIRGDGDPAPVGSGNIGSLDLVRSLVAQGADVNARHGKHRPNDSSLNRTDATPFLLACETGDVPLLRLLLELGADPTLMNADHVTPLLAAAGVGVLANGDDSAGTEEEAIGVIQMLLDMGADINAVDDEGKSAMHGAAFMSWNKLVQFLADHGAKIEVWNQKNNRGWTPLMIAQGHRPGNFRPSPETIVAVEQVMRAAGVEPPAAEN